MIQTHKGGDGPMADWWVYEDQVFTHAVVEATAGFDRSEFSQLPVTYEAMHPGCYDPAARLAALDVAGIEASLCFPSMFPRFCGQRFLDARDKELARLCVQAYNDWMIDEWAGGSQGRLIPLTIIPLWDPHEAAREIRRCAAKGGGAITFSENPFALGLPSIHDARRYWDPMFAACEDTGTVVNVHTGSSSVLPTTGDDSPIAVGIAVSSINSMCAFADVLLSGLLLRFPGLRIAFSEGQAGWMPFMIERIDKVWQNSRAFSGVDQIPDPPSTSIPGRIFGCIFDDDHAVENLHIIGEDQLMFEVDFPHQDSTWPNTQDVVRRIASKVTAEQFAKIVRGNAIRLYNLPLPTPSMPAVDGTTGAHG